ncbi:hypothetical protein G17_00596 [Escherichia phage vB_EcoM_G17]|nr:hypothetical protein G17_00596 [Escherichia phage vB_EcoM_G17]WNN14322.1 hypothetical protein Sharanji_gp034 [Escherichia phage Sharanji]
MNNITLQERFIRINYAITKLDATIGFQSLPYKTRLLLECEAKLGVLLGTQHQQRYVEIWIDLLTQNIYERM